MQQRAVDARRARCPDGVGRVDATGAPGPIGGCARRRPGESLTRTVLRTALSDDWTACTAAARTGIGQASPVALRLARAQLVRGNGDRPGRAGLRALLTVEAAFACSSESHSTGDVSARRPCEACARLRAAARPGP